MVKAKPVYPEHNKQQNNNNLCNHSPSLYYNVITIIMSSN